MGDWDKDTLDNPAFTYVWDKVVCMKGAYFAHVVFCYLVFLSGIGAFVTRVVPAAKWTHVWFGRAYIISMLWATATSLIIHNTGLPAATLISFIWALGGMCVAWVMIKFHELRMERLAMHNVQHAINKNGGVVAGDLRSMVAAEKGAIAASRTFRQRMLSIKAFHGTVMFVSWINIAGRIFASNQTGDFTCHTYPVYKPIDTKHGQFSGQPLTIVPTHDPNFARLPWARLGLAGWSVVMFIAPFLGAYAVGAAVALAGSRRARVAANRAPQGASEVEAADLVKDMASP